MCPSIHCDHWLPLISLRLPAAQGGGMIGAWAAGRLRILDVRRREAGVSLGTKSEIEKTLGQLLNKPT